MKKWQIYFTKEKTEFLKWIIGGNREICYKTTCGIFSGLIRNTNNSTEPKSDKKYQRIHSHKT